MTSHALLRLTERFSMPGPAAQALLESYAPSARALSRRLRDSPWDGLGDGSTIRLSGTVEGVKAHFVWDYRDEVFVTVFPCGDPAPQLTPSCLE